MEVVTSTMLWYFVQKNARIFCFPPLPTDLMKLCFVFRLVNSYTFARGERREKRGERREERREKRGERREERREKKREEKV